jgi:hypothetical protein
MDTFASADGRFVLEDVAEGSWVVEASAPDRANGVAPGVRVAAGPTVDVGRIRLTAGGTVRGVVLDTAGAPVAGANALVERASRDWSGRGREATTDPGGAFEVRGVEAGMVEVVVNHPSYAQGRSSAVEVDPTRGPAELRVVLSQGGRIEGRVLRRDGTGVQAMLNASAASPGGRRVSWSLSSTNTAPDGSFVMEHVPAGRLSLVVMTGSGGAMESRHVREVEVREGETTTVEFVSRDIFVSGHVTRGGAPAPGLRLRLYGADGQSMMMSAGGMGALSAPPTGPQRLTAVTDESGGFVLLADNPGKYHVNVTTVDERVNLPPRSVEIPDADAYTVDLAFSGVPVAGVVTDRDTEQPVPNAFVFVRQRESTGPGAGSGTTAADGRFQLEVEPGEYQLTAGTQGYGSETTDITVGAGGIPDLRLSLSRGGSIKGRVVDAAGRGLGGLRVSASSGEGADRQVGGAQTLPDGSFQIDGLTAASYLVVAQSDLGGFAMRTGISVGQEGVILTLQPGGRVQVRVRGPDGAPAPRAFVRVSRIAGLPVGMPGGQGTAGDGAAEIVAPAGTVEIEARKEMLRGTAEVDVSPGVSVPVEITLVPAAPPPAKP